MAREAGDMRRVEVGFSGGQVIQMRLTQNAYDQLRRTVQDGKRWAEVETDDGIVALDAGEVVFVRIETAEHRVGFSGL